MATIPRGLRGSSKGHRNTAIIQTICRGIDHILPGNFEWLAEQGRRDRRLNGTEKVPAPLCVDIQTRTKT
jgi:hypothetical protein